MHNICEREMLFSWIVITKTVLLFIDIRAHKNIRLPQIIQIGRITEAELIRVIINVML